MITFFICLTLLVAAYFIYGRALEKVVDIDASAPVPSETHYDGVDYMPLPRWRIFLIQLLNIAGTGPIFGAILGACYGPVAFVWITLGGILMGAMHDFVAGVISLRNEGRSLPETIGKYLGRNMYRLSMVVIPILMVLVGGVFIVTPSKILASMTSAFKRGSDPFAVQRKGVRAADYDGLCGFNELCGLISHPVEQATLNKHIIIV